MKYIFAVLSLILTNLPLSADLTQYVRRDPRLDVHPVNTRYDQIAGYQAQIKAWDDKFKASYGAEWEILVDVRGGRPGRLAGQGIPVIPGLGNTLTTEEHIGEKEIETIARSFLQENVTLFKIDPSELIVADIIQMDDFWYVNFNRYFKNLLVRGATALVMISHGNLVRLLTIAYGDINVVTTPAYSAAQAREQMFREIGGFWAGLDTVTEPGELMILPITTNGASAVEYTGGLGGGYGHLLTWRIVFERKGEGTWTAVMDAQTNQLLEFYSNSASGYSEGAVTGQVYYYPAPGVPQYGQAMAEKGVRMPYADLRYHFTAHNGTPINCYGSGEDTCRTPGADEPADPFCLEEDTISCPDIFDKKYCSGWSGRFCYPDPLSSPDSQYALDGASPLMTRLVSPYAAIHQYYDDFLSGQCVCEQSGSANISNMCVAQNAGKWISMGGGINDQSSCVWTQGTSTNPPGNSYAARTAYYHALLLKQKWLSGGHSALRGHGRPVERPDCKAATACPTPEYSGGNSWLTWWLTSRMDIYLHSTYGGNCDLTTQLNYDENQNPSNHNVGIVYLCRENFPGYNNRDSADVPGVIYHELGHGLDEFDGVPWVYHGNTSSEAYADIVAMLMTHDSCIARGWYRGDLDGNPSTPDCYGDGNLYDCRTCDGFRDLDHVQHNPDTVRTVSDCKNIPGACPPGASLGPCGKEAHTEGEIAGQAFWDFVQNLQMAQYGGYDEITAWEIAESLFRNAAPQLSEQFYTCNGDNNDGCADGLTSSLFMSLWDAADNDGNLANAPGIPDALCKAFCEHGIACNRDDRCNCPASAQSATPCPSIAQPVWATPGLQGANNTVYVKWGAAAGAYSYDIQRSDLGRDSAYIRIGSTSATELFDYSVANGESYWYRIVPLGASRSCIGPVSEARFVTPSATLMILPETQDDWLVNTYRRRKLQAWGGSGSYTWSIVTGSLPTGIYLDALSGELFGQPTTAQAKRTFTIQAADAGGSLGGTRTYQMAVVSGVPWLDFTPNFLPSARVSDGTLNTYYSVELLPASNIANYSFAPVSGEGALPPGLDCDCYWNSQQQYKCTIEGRVSCSGVPSPCTERGLYTFTVRMSSTVNNVTKTVDRTFDLPVLSGAGDALVVPAEGTTAGGTEVKVFLRADFFPSNAYARFEMPADCAGTNCDVSLAPESYSITYESSSTNDRYLTLVTPRSLEGDGALHIYFPQALGGDSAPPRTSIPFHYKTLAFTADQVGHSLSVIDTFENKPFAIQGKLDLEADLMPMNLAFSKGFQKDGRMLYVVDYQSGNLAVFDAANLVPRGEVILQDPTRDKPGPGAFDIAVSADGTHAFVAHISDGISESLNPHPGGVSVLTMDSDGLPSLYDLDCNETTTSSGAPQGYSRISTVDAYPLSLRTVMITGDSASYAYQDGEKWPGEYIFLSVVGETYEEYFNCVPDGPCQIVIRPRKAYVLYIDNNARLYCDPTAHAEADYCDTHWSDYDNPDYWEVSRTALIPDPRVTPAQDGVDLGQTSQGIGFTLTSGDPSLGPTVYMLNELENRMYMFHYVQDHAASHWEGVFYNGTLDYVPIPTGQRPMDIKVQPIALLGGPVRNLAYIPNAGDDTLTVLDTTTNAALPYPLSPMSLDACSAGNHYPTAFDVRQDGTFGYTANFHSASVSVFNLKGNQCQPIAPTGVIPVGQYPIRIAVQPTMDVPGLFASVRSAMIFAAPTAFTTPSKQPILVREWDHLSDLQDTGASAQAVAANIDDFQRSVNRWVAAPALQGELNQAVDLYRAAYLKDHSTVAGQ